MHHVSDRTTVTQRRQSISPVEIAFLLSLIVLVLSLSVSLAL